MRRLILAPFLFAACTQATTAAPPPSTATSEANATAYPRPEKILFWTPDEQLVGYQNVDKIAATRPVAPSPKPRPLPPGDSKRLDGLTYEVDGEKFDVDGFVAHNHVVGLLVLKDGKVLLERYERGNDASTRWISFSVTKSLVSLLVGAAIRDGKIESVKDPVTKYLPRFEGTAYDGVTIENVLQMASGVAWNEDYADPDSDVGKTARFTAPQHLEYLAGQPRAAEPGTKFNYNTGETHLVGALLRAAIGGDLAPYLEEKIWKPFGMETEAPWLLLEPNGAEHGGCCLSASLRDFGRIGMFTLADGALDDGTRVLPDDWMKRSTTPSAPYPGYGYLWWVLGGGTYAAIGIFGQAIWVSPADGLVVATHGMWPQAVGPAFSAHRKAFFTAVAAAVRD